MSIAHPESVLKAAAHPDPYPYYASLLSQGPLQRDTRINLWIALAAGVLTEIFADARCRVRPPAEPVPPSIAGAPAGDVFGNLVRMNEGPRHAKAKAAVGACLAALDMTRLISIARQSAAQLAAELAPRGGDGVDALGFALPVRVVAQAIGFAPDAAVICAKLTGQFVKCFSPLSGPAEIAEANEGAAALIALLREELRQPQRGGPAMLADRLQSLGIDEIDAVIANMIGFMSQTYDASAGLIGNTLLALARDPRLAQRVGGHDALLVRVIEEVARHDSPVHNTRRFLAEDATIAGQAMKPGDQIILIVAAANRDPVLHANPHTFDPDRADRTSFTFGAGRHACAGQAVAISIAAAAIQALLAHGLEVANLASHVRYRPSVNSRIPVFGTA